MSPVEFSTAHFFPLLEHESNTCAQAIDMPGLLLH
jgi:hypothetical protein